MTVQARPEPRELLAAAVAVVRPAAALVQRWRVAGPGAVTTKTSDTDLVSEADRAVEQQMVAELRRVRPHDAVLGEELGAREGAREVAGEGAGEGAAGEQRAGAPVRWLLDPIDGTVNYLYGIPWYAVSLAAEVDGQVVAGVVRNAANGQEWTAAAGHGAWRGGERLRGSSQTRLGQALVATGFGYHSRRRAHQARVVAGLLAEVRDIRRLGAAALDLCLAAEGTVDAFFEKGLSPWDHAAGGLVAAEAGLVVAGLSGAAPGPQMVVAAPPALFRPLHDRLVALDAAGGP